MISLRSKVTQRVLSYFFLQAAAELYVNQMRRQFDIDRGNLVRKLDELEREGLLISAWRGNQRYYRLNRQFPLLKEYRAITLKTVGIEKLIAEALKQVPGIHQAFIFGSYARNQMDASSDIDLMIVGDHKVLELHKRLAKPQAQCGREINSISMSPSEFNKKKESDDFLKAVLKGKRIQIL